MTTVCAILLAAKEHVLKIDVRSYPTRSFRTGINPSFMGKFAPLLLALAAIGSVRTSPVEFRDGLVALDASMKGAVQKLCQRKSITFDAWVRDYSLALRVVYAHAVKKRTQWEKTRAKGNTHRNPDWLMQIFDAMDKAEGSPCMSRC